MIGIDRQRLNSLIREIAPIFAMPSNILAQECEVHPNGFLKVFLPTQISDWPEVRLNCFYDAKRQQSADLHDHPFDLLSIVLSGELLHNTALTVPGSQYSKIKYSRANGLRRETLIGSSDVQWGTEARIRQNEAYCLRHGIVHSVKSTSPRTVTLNFCSTLKQDETILLRSKYRDLSLSANNFNRSVSPQLQDTVFFTIDTAKKAFEKLLDEGIVNVYRI